MSTTMNEIGMALSKYKPRVSIQENITISNYYYLHRDFNDFNSNCLYVCKSSQLPDDINNKDVVNLLIILDIPLPTYLQWWDKYNLILLEENKCSIYSLLEKLQDLINMNSILNHLTKSLIEGISKNLSLDELTAIAYNYLENPIIITNSSRYLCASYTGPNDINEPIWQNHISTGYAHTDYLKNIYYDLNFRQSISFFNQPIMVDYHDVMNHRMLISSLKRENFNLAHIYVLEVNKPFSRVDSQILNILNKILLPIVIHDHRFILTNNTSFDSLFYYLINNEKYDEKYVENYVKAFDLDLNNNLFLIYIEYLSNMDSFEQLKYRYDVLSRVFYNHYIYFYKNKIYIMYKGSKNFKEDENNFLVQFLKENNLKAGISQPFSDLKDFKNACFQSKNAILIGSKINSNKYIYYFNDYMIYNLVFTFISHDNMNDLIDISLMDFIKENNEEFVDTLKVFCENNGDMQKTSTDLHVHYNTLKYRLQKIKDLYSFDIFDNNFIINLKLSFLALDFLENKI